MFGAEHPARLAGVAAVPGPTHALLDDPLDGLDAAVVRVGRRSGVRLLFGVAGCAVRVGLVRGRCIRTGPPLGPLPGPNGTRTSRPNDRPRGIPPAPRSGRTSLVTRRFPLR